MTSDAAQRGYGGNSDAYGRGRPSYPAAAVAWAIDEAGIAPPARVVDLGAGTGALTVDLAARGYRVVAVDPVADMIARIPPAEGIETRVAPAEGTGLDDGVASAVFAATSWHWFDGPAALEEVRRISRPGGSLVLLWNLYDESVPWVREFAEVTYSRRDPSSPDARSGAWMRTFDEHPEWRLEHRAFAHPQRVDRAVLLHRIASSSTVASLGSDERETAMRDARDVLERHRVTDSGGAELPYVTHVHVAHTRGGRRGRS